MLSSPRSLALALALGAALSLAACGEEDAQLLPGETAREITANLDTVQQLSSEGDCVGAESAVQQVGEQIEAVGGVDPKLKRALEEGALRLEEVVAECEESPEESIAPAVIPEEEEEEPSAQQREQAEKEREAAEKEREREEGEREQAEGDDGGEDEGEENGGPPPQPQGEAKGLEEGEGGGPPGQEQGSEAPSGGVSPGEPAAEGE